MDVQPLRLVVHGAHAIGLEHAVLLGEIVLCKRLHTSSAPSSLACFADTRKRVQRARWREGRRLGRTYRLAVAVAERLAHQLAHPVVVLAVLGLQAGDYERHVEVVGCDKAAYKGSGKYGGVVRGLFCLAM